jgi:hypothetical protein
MLDTDLWLSVGYNVVGFFEKEFSSMAETSQGVFIRLRYRFDENTI